MHLDGGDFRMCRIDAHDMHGKSPRSTCRECSSRLFTLVERHDELLLVLVDVQRGRLVGQNRERDDVAFDGIEDRRRRDQTALAQDDLKGLRSRRWASRASCERHIEGDQDQGRHGCDDERARPEAAQGRSRTGSRPTIDLPIEASELVNRTIWNPLSWLVNQSSVSLPRRSQRMFEDVQSVVRFSPGRLA